MAADARPRGREVPVPAGQVRPQGVGRAGRGHPGRRGRAGHRPGPGRDRQLRHPDPAPPGPPGHRQGRRRVPAVGRGAAAAAVSPPGRGAPGGRAVVRVSFQAIASPAEHYLCTSDPAEIARMQAGQPAAAGPPGLARTARPRRTRRTCCHDIRPFHRPARPAAGSARRPRRAVPHQPRRLHRAPGPAAARRPGALRAGGRAAARRRGHRRDRGPGLAAPPAARRVRRGRPAGHRPGPAGGRPGRGGGAVGAPDRAAAPGLGTAGGTGSRTWAGSTPGPAATPPG